MKDINDFTRFHFRQFATMTENILKIEGFVGTSQIFWKNIQRMRVKDRCSWADFCAIYI
jgi:hypothetical protein